MDRSICQRLLCVEDDFLLSSAQNVDRDEAETLRNRVLAILAEVNDARKQKTITDETIAMAHSVTSRLAILANGFLDFHVKSTTLTTKLMSDIDCIFSQSGLKAGSNFGGFFFFCTKMLAKRLCLYRYILIIGIGSPFAHIPRR